MTEATMKAHDLKSASGDEAGADMKQMNVESPCYPRRNWNAPIRFSINALLRSTSDDEPIVRKALKSEDAEKWRSATWPRVDALQLLDCWGEIKHPETARVFHTEYELRHKRIQGRDIEEYKAGLVVCGNEEEKNNIDCSSPAVDYTMIRLLLCRAIQKNREVRLWLSKLFFQMGTRTIRLTRNCQCSGLPRKPEPKIL